MPETHHIRDGVRATPRPAGQVGARLRVPLTGTPSPRWSRALTAHLATDLTGHAAVGYLRIKDIVQGSELVLEGVEEREAPALGRCLRVAIDAANRACADDEAAPLPRNMEQTTADAIARDVGAPPR
jgi:hypothetical protein